MRGLHVVFGTVVYQVVMNLNRFDFDSTLGGLLCSMLQRAFLCLLGEQFCFARVLDCVDQMAPLPTAKTVTLPTAVERSGYDSSSRTSSDPGGAVAFLFRIGHYATA
jgi:hypothetical protein